MQKQQMIQQDNGKKTPTRSEKKAQDNDKKNQGKTERELEKLVENSGKGQQFDKEYYEGLEE